MHERLRRPLLLLCCLSLPLAGQAQTEPTVNPHWTGQHCAECHRDPGGKEIRTGDIRTMCLRCHPVAELRGCPHPNLMTPPDAMQPADMPLRDTQISCATCHDSLVQMQPDLDRQLHDPAFLRHGPYPALHEFCFACHARSHYQVPNPHEQRDGAGQLRPETCRACHREAPEPASVADASDVTFLIDQAELCFDCHPQYTRGHPARADHRGTLDTTMLRDLQEFTRATGIRLPLLPGRQISCTTCHNPHQAGVLQNPAAAQGAGAPSGLRAAGGAPLCIACHPAMQASAVAPPQSAPSAGVSLAGTIRFHEPWRTSRCKACHSVTAAQPQQPPGLTLCFRAGCHKPAVVRDQHRHDLSVTMRCTFCHDAHGTVNAGLLKNDDPTTCYICHPLTAPAGDDEPLDTTIHAQLIAVASGIAIAPDQQCGYCHAANHRQRIATLDTALCATCHRQISEIIHRADPERTIHGAHLDAPCSRCHRPHAGPYPYLLQEPLDTYHSSNGQ